MNYRVYKIHRKETKRRVVVSTEDGRLCMWGHGLFLVLSCFVALKPNLYNQDDVKRRESIACRCRLHRIHYCIIRVRDSTQ
jgi:hypothetical protein